MLTIRFKPNPDGSLSAGEFALVVSYAEEVNPDGTVSHDHHASEPEVDEAHPHYDGMRLVSRGTISGSISGGQAGASPTGALMLTGLQLQVTFGSLEFENFTGTGSLDADLSQSDAQGTLRIVF